MGRSPELSYDIYIAASPKDVWRGLVDGEMTSKYVYGTRLESSLKAGARFAYVGDGAFEPVSGEVIAAEPERFAGVTPNDLAAVAVSFIKGCAVQSMVEPNLDVAGFLRAAETLLAAPSFEIPDNALTR